MNSPCLHPVWGLFIMSLTALPGLDILSLQSAFLWPDSVGRGWSKIWKELWLGMMIAGPISVCLKAIENTEALVSSTSLGTYSFLWVSDPSRDLRWTSRTFIALKDNGPYVSTCLDLSQRLLFLSASEGETLGFGHSLLVHRGMGTSTGTLRVFLTEGSPVPSENHLIIPFVFPPGKFFFIFCWRFSGWFS